MAKLEEIRKELSYPADAMDKVSFYFALDVDGDNNLVVDADGTEFFVTDAYQLRDWLCEMLGNPSLTDEP